MTRQRNTNGKRGPGRPVKNVVPKINAPAEEIFKAMFRAARKKRASSLTTANSDSTGKAVD